ALGPVAGSMVTALAAWHKRPMSKTGIAGMACDIAIHKLKLPSGKQDEYGSVMGGVNQIMFSETETTVTPVPLQPETVEKLQRRIMLFYTGKSRDSGNILKKQSNASQEQDAGTLERMHRIKALGQDMLAALTRQDLDGFGDLLHQSWVQKRGVVQDISNSSIDLAYATARE